MKTILGNAKLLMDELYTVLLEVESILNSRPLTYIYDETGYEPLTPNHLLHGRRLSQLASNLEFNVDDIDDNDRFSLDVRGVRDVKLGVKLDVRGSKISPSTLPISSGHHKGDLQLKSPVTMTEYGCS